MNNGLYTDTAWRVPVLFRDPGGTVLDMSGYAYLADVLLNGVTVFRFRSTGAAADEGTIDVAQAESGVITFNATIAQHQEVAAGLYRLHLKRDLAEDTWQASGFMLVGAPGAAATYITFDAPEVESASAASYAAQARYWAEQAVGGPASINYILDGGGQAVTTGLKGSVAVPFACTIDSWSLVASPLGSITVDVWKTPLADYPPSVADSITGGAKPAISNGQQASSSSLGAWNTVIAPGDTISFHVDAASSVTLASIAIRVTRT